jgi:hypothetical protein
MSNFTLCKTVHRVKFSLFRDNYNVLFYCNLRPDTLDKTVISEVYTRNTSYSGDAEINHRIPEVALLPEHAYSDHVVIRTVCQHLQLGYCIVLGENDTMFQQFWFFLTHSNTAQYH